MPAQDPLGRLAACGAGEVAGITLDDLGGVGGVARVWRPRLRRQGGVRTLGGAEPVAIGDEARLSVVGKGNKPRPVPPDISEAVRHSVTK